MGYFGATLRRVLEEQDMTYDTLAAAAGLTSGSISNLVNGVTKTIPRETAEAVIRSFSEERHQAALTVSHLKDCLPPCAAELVTLSVRGPHSAAFEEVAVPYRVSLDDTFERALATLRQLIPHNPDLRLVIIDLVAACGPTRSDRARHDYLKVEVAALDARLEERMPPDEKRSLREKREKMMVEIAALARTLCF